LTGVRGLNDRNKRLAVFNKIDESNCSVICLHETKCENFDHSFIRSFCPKRFDQFSFSPYVGASGGIIVLWNSSIFMENYLKFIGVLSGFSLPLSTQMSPGLWSLFMVLVEVLKGKFCSMDA
jgi:hypothetical protein